MALVLPSNATTYRFDRRGMLQKPGYFEKAMVVVTTSTLLMGLPVDWFLTRAQNDLRDGNLKLVAAQLFLMLFAVIRVLGRLDDVIRGVKLEVSLFLFSLLALASLFWSADPGETVRQSIVIGSIAVYGLYLCIRFDLREILQLLAVMFTISAVCSLIFVFALPEYGLQPTGEWAGVFYHKNALGFAAAIGMPALIAAGRAAPRFRLVFYAAAAAHLVLLLFSESKTMFVAGFGSLALMAVFRLFRGRRTLRGAVLISMGGSAVFATAFATANIGLLAKWLDKDVTLTGRVPLWEDLIPVVQERVVFGHGYRAAFGGYFSPVHEVWIQHPWEPSHAHNALFHIWLELGLIGVGLFLLTFFRAVKRAIHGVNLRPDAVGLWPLVFLSTSMLISITESGITYTEVGWLMYVTAVLSVSNWFKNEPLPPPPGADAGGVDPDVSGDPLLGRELGSPGRQLVGADIG